MYKEKTYMKSLLFAAVLAVGAGADVLAEDEPLVVAQGETKNVTASESHTTKRGQSLGPTWPRFSELT